MQNESDGPRHWIRFAKDSGTFEPESFGRLMSLGPFLVGKKTALNSLGPFLCVSLTQHGENQKFDPESFASGARRTVSQGRCWQWVPTMHRKTWDTEAGPFSGRTQDKSGSESEYVFT